MMLDLLGEIGAASEVTHALILTYNIDLVFLQTVADAKFRKCGHPKITIFADEVCARETYRRQAPVVTGLGSRYRVVPVPMPPRCRFHPKALLLVGPERAQLFVGSGNLTFGGWRENGEIWTRFDTETDGTAALHAFSLYLDSIVASIPLPDSVEAEVREAFSPTRMRWAEALEPPSGLLARMSGGPRMLDMLVKAAPHTPPDEFVICAPYFDPDGDGLAEALEHLGGTQNRLLHASRGANLTRPAWERSEARATREAVHLPPAGKGKSARHRFVHAKFYALRYGEEGFLAAGSANCSRAALLPAQKGGNAELLALRSMPWKEIEAEVLAHLVQDESPDEIPESFPDPPTDKEPALRLLAARFSEDLLEIAYHPKDAQVVRCEVDGDDRRFSPVEDGVLSVSVEEAPRTVCLTGRIGAQEVTSEPLWVDNESSLRVTARRRNLGGMITMGVTEERWSPKTWGKLLEELHRHIEERGDLPRDRGAHHGGGGKKIEKLKVRRGDVFDGTYRAPPLPPSTALGGSPLGDRTESLRGLLRGWFGLDREEEPPPDPPPDPDPVGEGTGGSDEPVDQPEELPTMAPPKPRSQEQLTANRKRALAKTVEDIIDELTKSEYIETRPPELLGTDLKIATILLGTGTAEGWLDRNKFVKETRRLWSALFFSCPKDPTRGWLEHRRDQADDEGRFLDQLCSPSLSAALVGWALFGEDGEASLEALQFQLATVLAVARLPWLFAGGTPEEIAAELGALVPHIQNSTEAPLDLDEVRHRWELLIRRSAALRNLEGRLSGHKPPVLGNTISRDHLGRGELLWQGIAGLCMVAEDCPRLPDERVPILHLQRNLEPGSFHGQYTVPVVDLLAPDGPLDPALDSIAAELLGEWLRSIRPLVPDI